MSKNDLNRVPTEIHYNGEALEALILDDNPMEIIQSHSFSDMIKRKYLSICKMSRLGSVQLHVPLYREEGV